MKHAPALAKRANLLILAGLLAAATALPALLMQKVNAYAQPSERSIDISTSEVSATDVTYVVTFKPATSITAQGIVVDFCTSPLVGTECDNPVLAGFNTNEAGLAVTATGLTLDAATDTDTVVLTGSTALTAGATYTITLGGAGATDGVTNPNFNGSFYARIATYTNSADAIAYDSSVAGSATNPGPATDAGGVAMSTANQLTVNARVQEVLVFCVGTTDAGTNSDCSDISGTVVDLGVVQAGVPSISPVPISSGGNNLEGLAMVRTNAVNGVVIDYFSEAVTGDTGSVHLGALRVSGATCAGDGTIATGSKTDQCFNSAGATLAGFAGADEGFGMQVESIDTSNGTTLNLDPDAAYDGDGTNTTGWAWSPAGTDTIASSTASVPDKVVDDEMLRLRYAAQAAVTTPTGQYGVTSTYVATATY